MNNDQIESTQAGTQATEQVITDTHPHTHTPITSPQTILTKLLTTLAFATKLAQLSGMVAISGAESHVTGAVNVKPENGAASKDVYDFGGSEANRRLIRITVEAFADKDQAPAIDLSTYEFVHSANTPTEEEFNRAQEVGIGLAQGKSLSEVYPDLN